MGRGSSEFGTTRDKTPARDYGIRNARVMSRERMSGKTKKNAFEIANILYKLPVA